METYRFKTWPEFFKYLGPEGKTFEIRKYDPLKPVKVGDKMVFEEWDNEKKNYTFEVKAAECTYILNLADCPGIVEVHGSDSPGSLNNWRVYGLGYWDGE